MPYIEPTLRDNVDAAVKQLANSIREIECDYPETCIEGVVNYAITRLLDNMYRNGGYKAINEAIGVIECVKLEFYRRVAAPYEDNKREINGDVYDN